MKKSSSLLLEELGPGPLPGGVIDWKCWQVAGHMDRKRLSGPRRVRARSAYEARHAAAREHFGACDPLCVEVIYVTADAQDDEDY